MKYVVLIVRVLLGGGFVAFGLDHFVPFLNFEKPQLTEPAVHFFTAIGSTKYLTIVKALELIGGALVLTGLFLPLGIVILTPILVNIVLFDLVLMGKPGFGEVFLAMDIFLIFAYFHYFRTLFAIGAKPYVLGK